MNVVRDARSVTCAVSPPIIELVDYGFSDGPTPPRRCE